MSNDQSIPWHKNDALFRQLQGMGRAFEGIVAAHLIASGIGVRVEPMRTRPSVESRKSYRDIRDIVAICPAGFEADIEVKSRAVECTSAEDFPHASIFVDAKEIVDEKGPPTAVVCVSQVTGAMLVIPESSRPHWFEKTSIDRVRKIKRTWYVCPNEYLKTFDELLIFLNAR